MSHSAGAGRLEPAAGEGLDRLREEGVVGPVGYDRAEPGDGHIVDDEHDRREDRQGQPAVGDHLVDLIRGGELTGTLFLVAALHQAGDVHIALIGDDALRIVIPLLLGGSDVLLDVAQEVGTQL